jgi:hypothetical protein
MHDCAEPILNLLDRTPWSIAAALEGPLTSHLFDAMIPRFALHWDFQDLVDAIGDTACFGPIRRTG